MIPAYSIKIVQAAKPRLPFHRRTNYERTQHEPMQVPENKEQRQKRKTFAIGCIPLHYDIPMRRRQLLQAAATLPLPRLIAQENRKDGTNSWQLTKVWPNKGKGYRSALIEGYCGRQSVYAGDVLPIFVSANPARRFTIDIFRMGYYGGAGAPAHGPARTDCRPSRRMTLPSAPNASANVVGNR